MRVEELDKENKIIGFQDYINNNHRTIFLNGRLLKLNKKHRLIGVVINFINIIIKFYQLLKRLKKNKRSNMSKADKWNDKLNKIKEKYGNFSKEESDFLYENEYIYSKKDFNNLKSFKESFIRHCACFSKQDFEYLKDKLKYDLGAKLGKFINISSDVVELQRKTRCLNDFDKLRDINFSSEEKRKDTYFNVCYKFSHNGNDYKTKEKILKKYIDINLLEGFLVNLSKKEYNEFLMKVEEKRRLKEQE